MPRLKALCLSYGAGHIAMLLPVVQALRRQASGLDLTLLALTGARAAAVAAGEQPLGFADFVQLSDPAFVAEWGERLAPGNASPAVERVETLAYLGVNFRDLVEQHGMARAQAIYARQGRAGFYPVHFFRRLIAALRPDVLVTTNSPRSEQAAIAAAVALGVPTLSMLDLFALRGDPYLDRAIHADRITVLCEATRANLLAAGVAPQRIVVTGNPAFDECAGPGAAAAGREWRAAQGWQGLRVALWAGQCEPDGAPAPWAATGLGQIVQEQLLRWVGANPGVGLILRYHPNEWQRFAPPPPQPRVHWSRPDREALLPVLAAADAVIVQMSTTGLQAVVAGKRVICLRFSPLVQASGMDLSRLGLALGADSPQELPGLLDADPADSGAPSAASSAPTLPWASGGAAQRVARAVLDLLGECAPGSKARRDGAYA